MKINILGTEYGYGETTEREDARLEGLRGWCSEYSKEILVDSDLKPEEYKKRAKRHEIIHCFLAESGLERYCSNEILVDWVACQFPKLLKAFQDVNAL